MNDGTTWSILVHTLDSPGEAATPDIIPEKHCEIKVLPRKDMPECDEPPRTMAARAEVDEPLGRTAARGREDEPPRTMAARRPGQGG